MAGAHHGAHIGPDGGHPPPGPEAATTASSGRRGPEDVVGEAEQGGVDVSSGRSCSSARPSRRSTFLQPARATRSPARPSISTLGSIPTSRPDGPIRLEDGGEAQAGPAADVEDRVAGPEIEQTRPPWPGRDPAQSVWRS